MRRINGAKHKGTDMMMEPRAIEVNGTQCVMSREDCGPYYRQTIVTVGRDECLFMDGAPGAVIVQEINCCNYGHGGWPFKSEKTWSFVRGTD